MTLPLLWSLVVVVVVARSSVAVVETMRTRLASSLSSSLFGRRSLSCSSLALLLLLSRRLRRCLVVFVAMSLVVLFVARVGVVSLSLVAASTLPTNGINFSTRKIQIP